MSLLSCFDGTAPTIMRTIHIRCLAPKALLISLIDLLKHALHLALEKFLELTPHICIIYTVLITE